MIKRNNPSANAQGDNLGKPFRYAGGVFNLRLQSYYDILGISQSANSDQIKSAFRRLAKLYHPDKNPHGKDQFERILKAYEVLIDHSSRKQYDLKLEHGNAQNFKAKKSTSTQKEWSFSDEELKRRNYYKEHYKKEYERYANQATVAKKTYNEYKYILFAAPLAVGLLMFIVSTYEQSTSEEPKTTHHVSKSEPKKDELKIMADPYTAYFKKPVYDIEANRVFQIKNLSSKDLIVALFDEKNKFLRSTAIKSGYSIEISQLPAKELNIKFVSGKYWSGSKERKGFDVIGGFTEDEKFSILNTRETNGYSMTVDEDMLKAMDEISENDFFKRN